MQATAEPVICTSDGECIVVTVLKAVLVSLRSDTLLFGSTLAAKVTCEPSGTEPTVFAMIRTWRSGPAATRRLLQLTLSAPLEAVLF